MYRKETGYECVDLSGSRMAGYGIEVWESVKARDFWSLNYRTASQGGGLR